MSLASSVPDERHRHLVAAAAQANETRVRELLAEEPPWTSSQDVDALRLALQKASARVCLPLVRCLLEHGADVEPRRPGEIAAIFRAAENGRTDVVSLLLEHGASIEWRDRGGQSALFPASARGHLDTMQVLLRADAVVDARDNNGRTPLLFLASQKKPPKNILDCLRTLIAHNADIDAHDDIMRTPLLWAATDGNVSLVAALLSSELGTQADVSAQNNRGRTALHLAAADNMVDVVKVLLAHGAPVNASSDGRWTALHNAAQNGHAEVVSLLVDAKARVNAQLSNGMTPLHWAAFNGHYDVVDILLSRPETDVTIKDTFYRTPMMCAAEKDHRTLAERLAPSRLSSRLPPVARDACKAFEAKIVDFKFRRGDAQRVFKHSVYDLLYGWDVAQNKPSIPILPVNVKHQPAFRWIHLPANNITWVETLLAKTFVEGDFKDYEGFKALEKCFDQEHRGPLAHAHFMRSFCDRVCSLAPEPPLPTAETESTPLLVVSEEGEPANPLPGNGPGASQLGMAPTPGDRSPGSSTFPTAGDKSPKGESKKKKKGAQIADRHPKPHRRGTGPPGNPPGSKAAKSGAKLMPSLTWEASKLSPTNGKIVLFIPFLHYETDTRRHRMATTIKDVRSRKPPPENPSPDCLLAHAYLNHVPPLHPRRTLDQYFYHGIDTSARDRDQVVYRYCERHRLEPKVFMVDQLWMWILGGDLVITCFPQRWDQRGQDHLNVLSGIIEETNAKTRPPMTSVYDLAMLIANRCAGIFDRHRLGNPEYQFLDMFESSIGHVTNRETELFSRFNRASALSAQWLQYVRRNPRGESNMSTTATAPRSEDSSTSNSTEQHDPVFPDALLDIGVETSLLAEIKDIRDELNIIAVILESQASWIDQFGRYIIEELRCDANRRTADRVVLEIKKRSLELADLLQIHRRDILRMDRQADLIYVSLTHLLDLKQKHSNALEARFARDQAVIAGKQGQTIMVFTIVTVIFLPMSFIAAFFAINFREWQDGEALTIGYVSKYTFGIGLGISIPLIVMALTIDNIDVGIKRSLARFTRGRLTRPRAAGSVVAGKPGEGDLGCGDACSVRTRDREVVYSSGGPAHGFLGSRGRSADYEREVEGHAASRLSPVFGRLTGSRLSASTGGGNAGYGGRMRYSGDLERGSRAESSVKY